ncbi:MAG: rhomboid family intramembrane serine protease [Terriglobia bacterium]
MLSPRLRWKLERYRERLQGVFDSLFRRQPKPRVCFSCGRLVGALEKSCSHCGASQSALSLSAFKRVALAVIPDENPVTYALLFANLLFFAVAWMLSMRGGSATPGLFGGMDPNVLRRLGAMEGWRILYAQEYWRLVMPVFLHGGILHFGFNAFVLWQVGAQVEELFGSRRFLFLYLVTGVAGFVVSLWWHGRSGFSVGSSGALMGLIGILISYISQQSGFASEYRASLIRWAVFILFLGLLPGIDNSAHVGGLVTGLALGRLVSDRRPATAAARLGVQLMAWGSAAVILWSLAMVLLHLPPARGS